MNQILIQDWEKRTFQIHPKLNGNEIIISRKEEKLYTKTEVKELYQQYRTECLNTDGDYTMFYDEWLNKNL